MSATHFLVIKRSTCFTAIPLTKNPSAFPDFKGYGLPKIRPAQECPTNDKVSARDFPEYKHKRNFGMLR